MKRLQRPPARVWVWTAATLVVAAVAVLLWRTSSVAATSSTTAEPAGAPTGAPAAQLSTGWTADTTAAATGAVLLGGRVLVTDPHGLALRDAVTGEEAWHYRRADARVCGATAVGDLVVAVFRSGGGCDEAVALRAGTGVRQWTRNVSYLAGARISSSAQVVLASTPTGVTTLDPVGDNTRWRQRPTEGCRYAATGVGTAGVALVQRCADDPDVRVELRDGVSGTVTWGVDVPAGDRPVRLLGADGLVTVLTGDTVHVLSPTDGAELTTVTLPPPGGATPADEPLQQTAAGDVVLLWARGTAYALDATAGTVRWEQPAAGLPSVDPTAGTAGVLEDGGYVQRSLADGTEVARSAVDASVPAGGRTAQVGPAVVYTTADRALALR
ncbi:PQQ-binding-like beta-propeller repeat protein [Modestobacter sp. NPDC049651]|uniref:PQQ-binding-like beta-propeller repeat protein n=1 Tax=unclassified Modestobacter TaxID=2643866 RepID=UPI0034081FB6